MPFDRLERREFTILLGRGSRLADRCARSAAGDSAAFGERFCSALRRLIPRCNWFTVALRELGYVAGQNLIVFYRYAEGKPDRLADLAAALVGEKPDLLLALGGDVAPYAVKATSTIPIVFLTSADPIRLGLAASLARPGGNATGITLLLDDTASKRLELLKEVVPRVKHAAFLWNPDHPDNELREAERAAQSLSVRLQLVEMRGSGDVDAALRAVTDAGCDALYVVSSRQTVLNTSRIVDFATRHRSRWLAAGSLGARRWAALVRTKHQRHDASPRCLRGQSPKRRKTGRSAD